jgi:transposase
LAEMNPTSKSPLAAALDPVVAAVLEQLRSEMRQEVEAKDRIIAEKSQALFAAEAIIQQLKEALRAERVARYGKSSEKLSDLQFQLLDLEPGVSSDEIEQEVASGPLPECPGDTQENRTPTEKQQRARRNHPGRNQLPAHLTRVEEIIPCTPEQCICGKCGLETRFIGYEKTEVLGRKPAEYLVRVIMREKRACDCEEHGVATATVPERIAPKSIFSDEVIIDFLVSKFCDSVPIYRQRAILWRDLGIDVALTTMNDGVLRAGELLIPVVDVMLRDLLTGGYVQADETYCGVQTPEKKGQNHKGYFWQYSSPGKGVVFDFEMTRSGEVPKAVFKEFSGILHTDGYAGYDDDVGAKGMVHACCMSHARRKFIDALKVREKAKATDAELERVVVLMDSVFAIDRDAREQNLSLDDRHALRQERVPALLKELHALLLKMKDRVLPKSVEGRALSYTLTRWDKLTRFMQHPVIELSTNWAENSMRPICIGRRNWLHIGSKEAGPKIAAIFSIVESCRKLGIPIRRYLADVLPGMADRSIQELADITPMAYAAKIAK